MMRRHNHNSEADQVATFAFEMRPEVDQAEITSASSARVEESAPCHRNSYRSTTLCDFGTSFNLYRDIKEKM